MRKKFYITVFILCLIVSSAAARSYAAPGGLDSTFGTNGIVTTSVVGFTNLINEIAIQSDGKIVAIGDGDSMEVVRYNVNGSLDTTFNGTGMAEFTAGDARGVAIQPDGKIVVVGDNGVSANLDLKVVRYNTNGTLDSTFDGDGIVETAIGAGSDIGYAVAIQPDGKIIVSGRSDTPPTYPTSYAILRYNVNGSIDTSFGTQGIIVPQLSGNTFAHNMVLQPDGKIVIAHNRILNGARVLVMLRYDSNGQPDAMFGIGGQVDTPVGQGVEYAAVAMQKDGKIVVSCSGYTNATSYDFWVVRYNTDGSLDDAFGTNGMVQTPIGSGGALDQAKALAIQANGKIVVGGRSPNGSNSNFIVVRYNKNGSVDRKWGNAGIVTTDLGGNADAINAIAIQTNGRIVAAGESDVGSAGTRKFALARYIGDTAENFDYDRDGSSDISLFRPSTGDWYILASSTGSVSALHWGISLDELASGDYDGDLKTDIAVWRAGPLGYLYILNSFDNTATYQQFGQTGDDPSIIGDYDGDGKADPAVYRPGAAPGQQSNFYYRGSFNNPAGNVTVLPWGLSGDIAARGDYNGDGRLDPTVFRPVSGTWYSLNLTNGSSTATNWGLAADKLVPADYTGDGKTDYAVFRNGVWYILESESGLPRYATWGLSTDKLIPSDYDGDGRADVAVFRNGSWYIQQSSDGTRYISFGLSTDIPTPTSYLP
ncbi:MAG: hypothetical protein ABI646_08470 [Acidobacteriota bacterium]